MLFDLNVCAMRCDLGKNTDRNEMGKGDERAEQEELVGKTLKHLVPRSKCRSVSEVQAGLDTSYVLSHTWPCAEVRGDRTGCTVR